MNIVTRKQREIAAREQLILDCAAALLAETGYANLSMERVAEAVEYSKGTIYQHFACKEDLLGGLCLRGMGMLSELFTRAAGYDGNSRERMLAVAFSYELFVALHPLEFANMQTLKSAAVREKTSPANCQAMGEMEAGCMGRVAGVVRAAVEAGDLVLPNGMISEEVVFGLWSLQYGAMILRATGIPFHQLGVPDTAEALRRMNTVVLDGLGWRPLSGEFDFAATLENLNNDLFAAESRQLRTMSPTQGAHAR